MAVVGPSVPARRPFFREGGEVPALIKEASDHAQEPVFQFALVGGWPSLNSIVRLLTSLLAVLCSFSFAFVASLLSARRSRFIFTIALAVVTVFAVITVILDSSSLAKTANECEEGRCVTAVPDEVLNSSSRCICSVDAWYYFILGTDGIMLLTSVTCLVLTAIPMVKRRGIDAS